MINIIMMRMRMMMINHNNDEDKEDVVVVDDNVEMGNAGESRAWALPFCRVELPLPLPSEGSGLPTAPLLSLFPLVLL